MKTVSIILSFLLIVVLLCGFAACKNKIDSNANDKIIDDNNNTNGDIDGDDNNQNGDIIDDNNKDNGGNDNLDPEPTPEPESSPKILVVYFSATNTTEGVANLIAQVTGGDIWEIVPAEPYTSADLNYNNSTCRANVEQNNPDARPQIVGGIENISQYDIVFVGYPIWWGGLPKIIYTFFDTYDFSGKTIVPFCTSGGSGIAASASEITSLEPNATVTGAQRFSGSVSQTTIENWVNKIIDEL